MRGPFTKYHYCFDWILEVGEERLLEQKLLKEDFDSREEFMVFLVITLRFSKKLLSEVCKNPKLEVLECFNIFFRYV